MILPRGGGFEQIPSVALGVAPHGDGAIALMARRLFERHALGQHRRMVAGEIVGFQKERSALGQKQKSQGEAKG